MVDIYRIHTGIMDEMSCSNKKTQGILHGKNTLIVLKNTLDSFIFLGE